MSMANASVHLTRSAAVERRGCGPTKSRKHTALAGNHQLQGSETREHKDRMIMRCSQG